MADDRRAQLLEEYDDIVLSLLMDDYADLDGQRLWAEFERAKSQGDHATIVPDTDKKCRALIHGFYSKKEKQQLRKHRISALVRAAAIVLVLLSISTVTVLSVDAFRVPVLNFILDRSGKFAMVTLGSSLISESTSDNYAARFESVLPEGYTIIQRSIDTTSTIAYSTNQDGDVLLFSIFDIGTTTNIDADTLDYTEVSIGEQQALFSDSDGFDLIWLDERCNSICNMYASGIDLDTFWEIAASLITYS